MGNNSCLTKFEISKVFADELIGKISTINGSGKGWAFGQCATKERIEINSLLEILADLHGDGLIPLYGGNEQGTYNSQIAKIVPAGGLKIAVSDFAALIDGGIVGDSRIQFSNVYVLDLYSYRGKTANIGVRPVRDEHGHCKHPEHAVFATTEDILREDGIVSIGSVTIPVGATQITADMISQIVGYNKVFLKTSESLIHIDENSVNVLHVAIAAAKFEPNGTIQTGTMLVDTLSNLENVANASQVAAFYDAANHRIVIG